MSDFVILPAIDLRHGRVVRLAQGDPDRETTYGDDPLAVARQWQAAGAHWLHVVNLDGAFGEAGQANQAALEALVTTPLAIEFGGGIRDEAALARVLDLGVARVVIGTAAVEQPALLETSLAAYGAERVALGVDAREGRVQIRGWQNASPLTALKLAQRWANIGGRWLVFTDISRDGMGRGVNVAATADLAAATGLQVIASGGVKSLADVRRVRDAGLAGVIIGRALYEGQIQLDQALSLAANSESP